MENFDRSKIDFSALATLAAVHRTGSVSAAAIELGVNQSTVSYTIGRLRTVFGDPLFVRMGRGIVPTERCEALARHAGQLVRQFEDLARPAVFDPSATDARIVLSCNFYERHVLLPRLLARLRAEAPGLRIAVVQAHAHGHEQLLDGDCDLLISPLPSQTAGLFVRTLLTERYACFVDAGSSRARSGIALADYAVARHVAVNYEGGWKPFFHSTLEALGVAFTPAVVVPSFGAVAQLVAGTDLVLTAPSGLAAAFAPQCVEVAAPFDCRFEVHMFWTGRAHESPMNRWLRGHVAAAAREVRTAAIQLAGHAAPL